MFDRVDYWLKDQPTQNFGDSLSRIFMERLFLPVGSGNGIVHLVGSVIDDMFVESDLAVRPHTTPLFWGCGIRGPEGLAPENRGRIKILAVRGPISAAHLSLEGQVPVGDSALVLPVIYQPVRLSAYEGRSICIPHFHDPRSDAELLAISKCDAIVRPNVGSNLADIYRLIDVIVSADFVLSASLHGAIVAAAYERPFCFWDSGRPIDLPLKWDDFAASANFQSVFAVTVADARATYHSMIKPHLRLPALTPLIENAPFIVWPEHHLQFRAYDATRSAPQSGRFVSHENVPTVSANESIGHLVAELSKVRETTKEPANQAPASSNLASEFVGTDAHSLKRAKEQYDQTISLLNSRDRVQRRFFQRLKFLFQSRRYRKIIEKSGLFDEAWYRETYTDIGNKPLNALRHYVNFGRFEGRNPNPYFNTIWYLWNYPHVLVSGTDPLVHYIKRGVREGRNPGPDFDTKAYLKKFPELGRGDTNPLYHFMSVKKANRGKPTVVIIDVIYPTPDKDSGSIDTANFITVFIELGFHVVFIADAQFHHPPEQRGWIESVDVEIIESDQYASVGDYIAKDGASADLFLLSRVHAGGRYFEEVARNSQAKVIFNTVDLHFLRERRGAVLSNDRAAMDKANATFERELHLCRLADATIVVSEVEGELVQKLVPGGTVAVIPLARSAPGSGREVSQRSDVGFIGGFAHQPNVDAITWFMSEIWPIIKSKNSSLKFYIYGSNMPATFDHYISQGVVPVGYVESVDLALDNRKVMVAPLRYGAGAKGKVVTSLAHGVPCVATSIAVEGMGLEIGKDVIVANTVNEFAEEVASLCTDEAKWNSISASGFEFIERNYSYRGMVGKVRDLLDGIGVLTTPAIHQVND